ncbi:helix-turn-helix domain-containing protein [Bordetella tumulicola]|uniref:helix-turn-helix domain-containing protein n=1 Tax=Bordetella tumulicola TaxID=1649133 RepID=UPI0039EFF575
MDALIRAAAQALAKGDVLDALKHVALRDEPAALALRGIAMAQLGELSRAKVLLKRAATAFGQTDEVARARCVVAEAEIALVSRDLNWPAQTLDAACATLEMHGDLMNAAHARNLAARRLLLIGRVDEAAQALSGVDPTRLAPALRAAVELTMAGIAIRRLDTAAARSAFAHATEAARRADIPALTAEVESATGILDQPAARAITCGAERVVLLDEVESLLTSGALVIDACRGLVRGDDTTVRLAKRPVLFTLVRCLGEASPSDVPRETLMLRAFRAKHSDESHRARLRVEIGRLRVALGDVAKVRATKRGFVLAPRDGQAVVVLAPLVDERNVAILALLADGEAWSSSALAIALGMSARTVQRALEPLRAEGKVQAYGDGRARRWTVASVPGFPTALLLPDLLHDG